jgi:Tail tubular protein
MLTRAGGVFSFLDSDEMLQLTVVNTCLGTMGEQPLNAIDDPHPYRPAAVSILNTVNREFQARGWWFNRETMTLQPGALDGSIYLPGDAISVRTESRNYVQRYRRLYNLDGGTYVFEQEQAVTLLRLVPFEHAPELFSAYAAAEAVMRFQKRYDGDSAKTRELNKELTDARIAAMTEETRQVKANLIDSNARLSYIKSRVQMVRGRRF